MAIFRVTLVHPRRDLRPSDDYWRHLQSVFEVSRRSAAPGEESHFRYTLSVRRKFARTAPLALYQDALVIEGLARLEQQLRYAPTLFDDEARAKDSIIAETTDNETSEWHFEQLLTDKSCFYRKNEGRDLFCKIAIGCGTAITSRDCLGCLLPDTRLLCDNLAHPDITISPSGNSLRARCHVGEKDLVPQDCRLGGHPCAQKFIRVEPPASSLNVSPVHLPDALDFLDAVWRLRFPQRRLLHLKSVDSVATLAKPCITRSDFIAALSALDDIFKRMEELRDLLSEEDRNHPNNEGERTLNQLACVLRNHGSGDPEEALTVLRNANKVRVALQHSARASELPKALQKFGITGLPVWSEAWDKIRVNVILALNDLRRIIEPKD